MNRFMQEEVTIFIGAGDRDRLAALVLESSIRRRTSGAVRIESLNHYANQIPEPQHPENRPKTSFSFQRFLIPEVMNFQGRAIYLDSDMLLFTDIRELWSWSMDGHGVLGCERPGHPPQFSVLLLDCGKVRWSIAELVAALDSRDLNYESLMTLRFESSVSVTLPEEWNSIEKFLPGRTRLLHYSNQNLQPWRHEGNPLESLWLEELRVAVKGGMISREQVNEEACQGHLRHELLCQL